MKRIRTHRFASGVYRISQLDIEGYALVPHDPPEICVAKLLSPSRELAVWLHEAMHAEFPEMNEDRILAAEGHIGGFLWRLGYRQKRGTR